MFGGRRVAVGSYDGTLYNLRTGTRDVGGGGRGII